MGVNVYNIRIKLSVDPFCFMYYGINQFVILAAVVATSGS